MSGGPQPGGGRPPKVEPRDVILQVRIRPSDDEDLRRTAAYYRMTVAQLVRKALGIEDWR